MAKAKKTKPVVQARAPTTSMPSLQGSGTGAGSSRNKWTVMVVGGLSKGPMRFNALLRLIGGVSHRMLTLTLRGLEHDGLVKRTVYPAVPAKVDNELTHVGRSLIKPLSALSTWVQNNRPAIEAARASRSPWSEWARHIGG